MSTYDRNRRRAVLRTLKGLNEGRIHVPKFLDTYRMAYNPRPRALRADGGILRDLLAPEVITLFRGSDGTWYDGRPGKPIHDPHHSLRPFLRQVDALRPLLREDPPNLARIYDQDQSRPAPDKREGAFPGCHRTDPEAYTWWERLPKIEPGPLLDHLHRITRSRQGFRLAALDGGAYRDVCEVISGYGAKVPLVVKRNRFLSSGTDAHHLSQDQGCGQEALIYLWTAEHAPEVLPHLARTYATAPDGAWSIQERVQPGRTGIQSIPDLEARFADAGICANDTHGANYGLRESEEGRTTVFLDYGHFVTVEDDGRIPFFLQDRMRAARDRLRAARGLSTGADHAPQGAGVQDDAAVFR